MLSFVYTFNRHIYKVINLDNKTTNFPSNADNDVNEKSKTEKIDGRLSKLVTGIKIRLLYCVVVNKHTIRSSNCYMFRQQMLNCLEILQTFLMSIAGTKKLSSCFYWIKFLASFCIEMVEAVKKFKTFYFIQFHITNLLYSKKINKVPHKIKYLITKVFFSIKNTV